MKLLLVTLALSSMPTTSVLTSLTRLLVGFSARVAYIFTHGYPESVWLSPGSLLSLIFDAGQSGNNLDSILRCFLELNRKDFYTGNEYATVLGKIFIIRFGPDKGQWTFFFGMQDPGNLKYDPRFKKLKEELQLLLKGMRYALEATISRRLKKTPFPSHSSALAIIWLKVVHCETEAILVRTGIRQQFQERLQLLQDLQRPIFSDRTASSLARRDRQELTYAGRGL